MSNLPRKQQGSLLVYSLFSKTNYDLGKFCVGVERRGQNGPEWMLLGSARRVPLTHFVRRQNDLAPELGFTYILYSLCGIVCVCVCVSVCVVVCVYVWLCVCVFSTILYQTLLHFFPFLIFNVMHNKNARACMGH